MAVLDQMRHFVAVIEHQGFRKAAEAVHISQPALTKSIQKLERSFGVELVDRSTRRAAPTALIEEICRVVADSIPCREGT